MVCSVQMKPDFGIAKLQSCIGIGIFLCCPTSLENINFEHKPAKIIQKSLKFGSKFGFRGPVMMEKIPNTIVNYILSLKCGFGIGYGIGQKYQPIWVSVSVSDLNQNT